MPEKTNSFGREAILPGEGVGNIAGHQKKIKKKRG